MDNSPSLTTIQRKKVVYIVMVAGFLVMCGLYFVTIMGAADASASHLVDEWIAGAKGHLTRNVSARARDARLFLLENAPQEGVPGPADLAAMERKDRAARYLVVESDGLTRSSGGKELGRAVRARTLRAAREAGIAFALVTLPDMSRQQIAEVAPLPGAPDVFVARLADPDLLPAIVLSGVPPLGDRYFLYNNEHQLTLEPRPRGAPGAGDDALLDELREFMYSNQPHAVVRFSGNMRYAAFVALEPFDGWVLAAHMPVERLLPFFVDMLSASFLVLGVVFFLIILVILLDMVNDREKSRELARLNGVDFLTGLLNEVGFQNAVKEFLALNTGVGYCLVCIDIASFRRINSVFGFAVGDRFLAVLGQVLQSESRFGSRISGDVFACLFKTSLNIVETLESKILAEAEKRLEKAEFQMLSLKYGVNPIFEPDQEFTDLYDGALLALKAAKSATKQKGVVYDMDLRKKAELNKKIEMNMLHAMSKDEFVVYIQPKYDLQAKHCAGGEALVRWCSEDIGFVTPDSFIPLFEKNGFIVELDFFMLATVFQMLAREIKNGMVPRPISINQSKVTIAFPNYLERMEKLLGQFDVPVNYVELEITESFLADDYDRVLSLMYSLKDFGFSLAMDDFGSGYSSLNTLREMPVDVLKIDKSFLRESDTSERSRTIIRNVINMSLDLGVSVVCEGVETKAQLDFLTEAGCNTIQGYYYAKPMPYAEYERNYLNKTPSHRRITTQRKIKLA